MTAGISPLTGTIDRLAIRAPISANDSVALLGLPHAPRSFEAGGHIVREGDAPDHCRLLVVGLAYGQKISGGGDEFAFCLAVHDKASAKRKSDAIHAAITAALGSSGHQATCSLGATTGTDVAGTLRVANRTMYGAKNAGKGSWAFEEANGRKHPDLGDGTT